MNGTICGRCGAGNDPRGTVCARCGAGLTASPYVDAIVNHPPAWSQPPYPPAPVQAPSPAFADAKRDSDHLRLLEIGYYIVGGMVALFSCIPLIHLTLGIGILTGVIPADGDAALLGGIFVAVALVIILAGWTIAGCLIGAGRSIKKRRRHMFCQIVAVISCLWMPLGTILGVFSLMVLNRPSVKAQFGIVS